MIRAIIFDCFGVLTADKWREFTATLQDEQREQAHELNRAYGGGFISKSEFLKAVEGLTGRIPQDIDDMLDNETAKNTELLAYIAELKPNYKIGLLSNIASNWIRDHFLSQEEQNLFDDFVFSYEVRMTKPDRRMFNLAAERLGVRPEECILIDDVERYCEAAKELGMYFVQYQDFAQAKSGIEKILASQRSE